MASCSGLNDVNGLARASLGDLPVYSIGGRKRVLFQEEEITLDAEIFHGADDSFLEGFAGKARGKPCFGLTRQLGIDGGNEISASGRVISFLSEKEKLLYDLTALAAVENQYSVDKNTVVQAWSNPSTEFIFASRDLTPVETEEKNIILSSSAEEHCTERGDFSNIDPKRSHAQMILNLRSPEGRKERLPAALWESRPRGKNSQRRPTP
ncbi:hypothetical protein RRG08_033659 [Elysia crispata]|uniref:Uncharacterized protein n=1 Tax=Elysia crispata TaxID=231223 RepID=A0AAE0YM38_9GAST|nr:hypothetical protein RRG08_033659 [Elysia crispata]